MFKYSNKNLNYISIYIYYSYRVANKMYEEIKIFFIKTYSKKNRGRPFRSRYKCPRGLRNYEWVLDSMIYISFFFRNCTTFLQNFTCHLFAIWNRSVRRGDDKEGDTKDQKLPFSLYDDISGTGNHIEF